MDTFTARRIIGRATGEVWSVVADYGQDPAWRRGVETMGPSAPGLVEVGLTTAEVLHLGGRTYRNDGVVTSVEPGRRFEWRTTQGADASGSRTVRPVDGARCEVELVLHVQAHGLERLLRPVLARMLRRGLVQDLDRLAALVESGRAVGVSA